jgi:hypothetical protein
MNMCTTIPIDTAIPASAAVFIQGLATLNLNLVSLAA